MFIVKSVPIIITTTILSGIVALSLVLHVHKKFDPLPPPGRDPGLLKMHLGNTLLTWG